YGILAAATIATTADFNTARAHTGPDDDPHPHHSGTRRTLVPTRRGRRCPACRPARTGDGAGPMKPYLMKPYLKSMIAFLAVAVFYWISALDFIENKLIDWRYQVVQRETTGSLVVVKIDTVSLDDIPSWPWKRSLYADLLDRLFAAGAADVSLDVDF